MGLRDQRRKAQATRRTTATKPATPKAPRVDVVVDNTTATALITAFNEALRESHVMLARMIESQAKGFEDALRQLGTTLSKTEPPVYEVTTTSDTVPATGVELTAIERDEDGHIIGASMSIERETVN